MEGRKKEQRVRERVQGRAACWPFPVLLPWQDHYSFPEPHGSHQMRQMWKVPPCQLLEQLHTLLLLWPFLGLTPSPLLQLCEQHGQ